MNDDDLFAAFARSTLLDVDNGCEYHVGNYLGTWMAHARNSLAQLFAQIPS
jgi:hypothetical protein